MYAHILYAHTHNTIHTHTTYNTQTTKTLNAQKHTKNTHKTHIHRHTHRGERWHEVRSVSRCRAMDPPPQPNPILRPPPCSPLASVCVCVCVCARARAFIAFAYVSMDMYVGICAEFRIGFNSMIGFSSGCRRLQAASRHQLCVCVCLCVLV